jgi:hypothetical protein
MKILTLALFVAFQTVSAPTIRINDIGDTFLVQYEAGAEWACTVYRSVDAIQEPSANFPDGHYAPRHCWALEPTSTSYQDNWARIESYIDADGDGKYDAIDWTIKASIGYPSTDGTLTYIDTNSVRGRR